MPLPDGLLEGAKNYLDITWEDINGDIKLLEILMRGMHDINNIGGASFDYEKEEKPRALLYDYARYARSNALDEFRTNYLDDLLGLQRDCFLGKYTVLEESG